MPSYASDWFLIFYESFGSAAREMEGSIGQIGLKSLLDSLLCYESKLSPSPNLTYRSDASLSCSRIGVFCIWSSTRASPNSLN
jgi:hypothetical protein